MKVAIFSIVLIITLTNGCSHTQPYPSQWPPLASLSQEQCFDISGSYRALSEPDPGNTDQRNLSLLYFLFERDLENRPAIKISVTDTMIATLKQRGSQGDHFLKITLHEGPTVIYEEELSERKGDFQCSSSEIEIDHGWRFININVGPASQKDIYKLLKDEEGSLILKGVSTGGGAIMFVLPVWGKGIEWWRWEKTTN